MMNLPPLPQQNPAPSDASASSSKTLIESLRKEYDQLIQKSRECTNEGLRLRRKAEQILKQIALSR